MERRQINIEGREPVLGSAPVLCPMSINPSLLPLVYNTQPWTVCLLVSPCVCVTFRSPRAAPPPYNPSTLQHDHIYYMRRETDRQTQNLPLSEITVNMITLLPSYPCHLCQKNHQYGVNTPSPDMLLKIGSTDPQGTGTGTITVLFLFISVGMIYTYSITYIILYVCTDITL